MKKVIIYLLFITINFLIYILPVYANDGQIILCEYEHDGKNVLKIQFNPLNLEVYTPDDNDDAGQWMIQYKQKESDHYEYFYGQPKTVGSFDLAFYQSDIINISKDKNRFSESMKTNFSCPKYVNIEYDGWWHRACFTNGGDGTNNTCQDGGNIFEYNAQLSTTSDTLYNKINDYANSTFDKMNIKDILSSVDTKNGSNDYTKVIDNLKSDTKVYVKKVLIPSYGFETTYVTPLFIKNIDKYIDEIENHAGLIDKLNERVNAEKLKMEKDNARKEAIKGTLTGQIPTATPEEAAKIQEEINKIQSEIDSNNQTIDELNQVSRWIETTQIKVGGINIPDDTSSCEGLLGSNVSKIIKNLFKTIQYAGPILVAIFTIMDFVKAVLSGEAEDMKKASNKLIKRLIAVVLLFFIPLICDMLLDLTGITTSNNCSFK